MDEFSALLEVGKRALAAASILLAVATVIHHARFIIDFLTWFVKRLKADLLGVARALGRLYRELTSWNATGEDVPPAGEVRE